MRKKGFTLVELIAIVAVIGVIVLAATASYMGIRRSVLKKNYNNLVTYLESQAAKYAEATGITIINVEDLIKEGYVDPDDETDIYNPEDNSSLNCNIINMTYENGSYSAKMEEEATLSEDGKSCGEYEQVNDYEIEVINTIGETCSTTPIENWYNCDVELGVKIRNGETLDGATYEWTSSNGSRNSEATITTNTAELSQNSYHVKVTKDLTMGEASKEINIDKQKPVITNVKIEQEEVWYGKNKKVEIEATDYNGSGVSSYYIGTSGNCNEQTYGNENSKELENGKYYACVKDKAGNISESYEFEVTKVDTTPDKPEIASSDGITSGNPHSVTAIDLTFKSNYSSSGKVEGESASTIYYEYGTSENNLNSKGSSVHIDASMGVITYYVRACNESGLCSSIESYKAVMDTTPPEVTITSNPGQNTYTNGNVTLTINIKDDLTGVAKYYISTSSSKPSEAEWINANNQLTYSFTKSVSDNITYYVWAKDLVGNITHTYKSFEVGNIDKIKPNCEIKITNGTLGSNSWYKSDVQLSLVSSDNESGILSKGITTNSTETYNNLTTVVHSNETTGTTYYGYVKDKAVNSRFCSISIKIDKNGPSFSSKSGSMDSTQVPEAVFNDSYSTIQKIEYCTDTNSTSCIENQESMWKTTRTYSFTRGTPYYAYARAIDYAGNKSTVQYLDYYFIGANTGRVSTSSGSSNSNTSSNTSSSSSNCIGSCYMSNNSYDHNILNNANIPEADKKAIQSALHADSEVYNKSTGSNYSYNGGSGTWSNSSGKLVNTGGQTGSNSVSTNSKGQTTFTSSNGDKITVTNEKSYGQSVTFVEKANGSSGWNVPGIGWVPKTSGKK